MHSFKDQPEDKALSLWILPGIVVFVSPVTDNSPHQHPFIQLTISLKSKIHISFEGISKTVQSVLINGNQTHQLDSCNEFCAVFLIDPELEVATFLKHNIFSRRNIYFPDFDILKKHQKELVLLSKGTIDVKAVEHLVNSLINQFSSTDPITSPKNKKIAQALMFLENLPEETIGVKRLAEDVGLSVSRLTHLFKEEVGMPVRRYILWLRLQKATREIVKGASFTEAAYFAGFSDSAHLSRTFRKMFGQKMLDIFSSYNTASPITIKTSLS